MADPDYFTLAEFRELPDMGDAATYTDAKVLRAAAYFTAIVERELDVAMIPREVVETLDGSYFGSLFLSASMPISLTSIMVDGTSVGTAGVSFTNGQLRYLNGTYWSGAGPSNIVVTYMAGEPECPADVKDAVMWATRDRLLSQAENAGIDARRTSITTDFGTTNYVLPGEKRPTGFPELDAVIAGRLRSPGPSVA